ncbi:hypothetical protein LXL04_038150 [Taraxacum kok-saghyz]
MSAPRRWRADIGLSQHSSAAFLLYRRPLRGTPSATGAPSATGTPSSPRRFHLSSTDSSSDFACTSPPTFDFACSAPPSSDFATTLLYKHRKFEIRSPSLCTYVKTIGINLHEDAVE